MKYEVGERVKVKSLDWYYDNRDRIDEVTCGNTNFIPDMVKYCGEIVTISSVLPTLEVYHIKEDDRMFNWTDEMIEGLAEEDNPFDDNIPLPDSFVERMVHKISDSELFNAEPLDIPTMTTDFVNAHGLPCPDGYEFRDENGNVIEAKKIVLEKKGKEYPKSYKECCETLYISTCLGFNGMTDGEVDLYGNFISLIRCRDAYWKIAGDWIPDWLDDDVKKYVISCNGNYDTFGGLNYSNRILAFPTAEMRDAFYENFRELIEECKELL